MQNSCQVTFFLLIDFIELPLFPPLIDALCKSLLLRILLINFSSTKGTNVATDRFKTRGCTEVRTLALKRVGGNLAKKKATLKTVDQSLAYSLSLFVTSNKTENIGFP